MIQIKDKADCCGCTACASICPKDAISMEPDVLGFKYPKIDLNKCIDCGLCEKVCAFNENYDKSLNLDEPDIYAARHKDMHAIETSRSGAAFIAISDYVLENGGIVYGVGYKDHFVVTHKRATTKEERNEFKGSKYVQSDLDGIFRQVKNDLGDGKTVLFSGTPCQTAGLNSFVGKKLREKLILVDIVCHGVPSPYIWRDYLNYLEKKQGAKIIEVNFRDKQKFGWASHYESYKFPQNTIITTKFTYLFFSHLMSRESCGKCHYANTIRPSDITIGDFWGWEKTDPEFNKDNKGCSLIFINTIKGRTIFNLIKQDLNIIPTQLSNSLQPNLQHPSTTNPKRILFEQNYKKKGFEYILNKYGDKRWKQYIRKYKSNIREQIKKILLYIVKYDKHRHINIS